MRDLGKRDQEHDEVRRVHMNKHQRLVSLWRNPNIRAQESRDERNDQKQWPSEILQAAYLARSRVKNTAEKQSHAGYNDDHGEVVRQRLWDCEPCKPDRMLP